VEIEFCGRSGAGGSVLACFVPVRPGSTVPGGGWHQGRPAGGGCGAAAGGRTRLQGRGTRGGARVAAGKGAGGWALGLETHAQGHAAAVAVG
jgi:hypothetical protein